MTDFALDPANEKHAEVLARFDEELIGWLGTIGRDGFPHAVPVWFIWHDGAIVVLNQPTSAKIKNLRQNPRALFHLEGGPEGEHLHVLQGTAEISPEPMAEWLDRIGEAYLAKYAPGIAGLGWDPERMWREYPTVALLRPHKLIAW